MAHRSQLERESAALRVCSACRAREEDVRSALPGPSAEHATGSETKHSVFPRICACVWTSPLPPSAPARTAQVGGHKSDSNFGVRGTTWLRSSASPMVRIRLPLPRRTPSCTHLENMFSSCLPPADSRQTPPEGRTPLPADRPSASRSRAGRGTRLFRDTFLREGRGGGRSTDHGTEGCHMLPDVLRM